MSLEEQFGEGCSCPVTEFGGGSHDQQASAYQKENESSSSVVWLISWDSEAPATGAS